MTLIVAFRTSGGAGGRDGRGGWILSTNNLFSPPPTGPVGFGLYIDEVGAVRPLVGSENRYTSSRQLGSGMHVATLVVSRTEYKLWLNSTLEFSKLSTSDPSNPQTQGPRSASTDPAANGEKILNSSLPLTLGVGATAGQLDEYFNGGVAEVLIFKDVLPTFERERAERMMCIRWRDCVPAAGNIVWAQPSAIVGEVGEYYNIEVGREGGSDGLVSVTVDLVTGTAAAGDDFFIENNGDVTFEHGDVGPKFIVVRILDHYERRMSNQTLKVFIRPVCATFKNSLHVVRASFNLTIEVTPSVYWTNFDPKLGGYTGGHDLTFEVVGLTNSSYACNFTQPIEHAECTCVSGTLSVCKQTRSVECTMAESPCKIMMPAHTVNVADGTVTCLHPLWRCKGHDSAMQLLRAGTEKDTVCRAAQPVAASEPVTSLLQSSAGSMDVTPVHYSWGAACFIPEWVLVDMELAVSSDAPNQLNFGIVEPSIQGISPRNGRTVGGDMIILTGELFGTYDNTPVIRIGDTSCNASMWISETSVSCTLPRGWGANHTVKWIADGNAEGVRTTAILRYSYDLPVVIAVEPSLLSPHAASTDITIFGANFGTQDFSPDFRLLPSSATTVVWTSDSSVTATVKTGLGGVLSIETIVGGVSSNSTQISCTELVGYGPTTVTSIQPASLLLTAGGSNITIIGSDFGTMPVSDFRVFVGSTEGELTWTSDTSCTAKVAAGAGLEVPIYLSLNGMWSVSNQTVSYTAHSVTGISPARVPVANSHMRVHVLGTNFGPGLQPAGLYDNVCSKDFEKNRGHNMTVGDKACTNVTYLSSTSLSCLVAPGVGHSLNVGVFINGYSATLAQGFSYDYPRTDYTSPSSLDPSNTLKTHITVTGENFGLVDFNPNVTIGSTQCGTSTWISDTSLVCYAARGLNATHTLPLQGVGSVDVVVHVAGQETPSGPLAVKFNFSSPVVTATQPLDSPGTGKVMVTFYGQNFGMADYTPTGKVGNQDCLTSDWQSDSKLLCLVPRAPADLLDGVLKAGVIVAGVVSKVEENFRYMVSPQVISVQPSTAAARGGDIISITGTGFGTGVETVVASINSEDCLNTQWLSQSSLACTSPPGVGARRSVGVEVTSQSTSIYGSKMNSFAFKPPTVENVKRAGNNTWNGPTTGAISMTIIGENFGVIDGENQAQAGIGNTICTSTGWTSDSSLGCRTDAGIGGKLHVWVRIACGAYRGSPRFTCRTTAESSTYGTFTYDKPDLEQVVIQHSASLAKGRGNQTLIIKGSNYGTYNAPLKITIGSTNASSPIWTSDSSITCVTGGGLSTNNIKIIKYVDLQEVGSVWKNALTYSAPVIKSISPDFGVSSGGQTVTVVGENFSPFDHSAQVRLGDTMCAASEWQSDSTVLCKTPAGAYIQRTAFMTLDQSYTSQVLNTTRVKAFNFSAGSCAEILKYEPGTPTGEYVINPGGHDFTHNGFMVFCRMGRERVGTGGLGSLSHDPILWLDASDESYLAYEWYDVNASGIPGSANALVYVEGNSPKWRERYSDSGTYRSPISGWVSRVAPYNTFGQDVKGRRPMFVANTDTSIKSAGNPTGIMDGLNKIHPGVVRFDGFDDFLVSDLFRNDSNSVSVFMAVATQSDSKGGFAFSDNHMDPTPSAMDGFGVFFEADGHVRTIAGSELRYTSSKKVGNKLQIVSAVADSNRMSLWIDSELKSGFDKYSCTGGVSDYRPGKPCLGPNDKISCGRTSSAVPTTNLQLWLDSKFGITRNGYTNTGTISSAVKTWTSTSGCSSCKRLDATSSTEKPELVDHAINGLPAIKFSAAKYATVLDAGLQFNAAKTIIVVQKSTCSHPTCNITSSHGMFLFGKTTGSGLGSSCFDQAHARVNGQNASLFSGPAGFTVTTLLTSGVGSCSADVFDFLGKSGASDGWEGQVAELLVWSSELALSNVYTVEDYLMAKYNVGVEMCARTGVGQVGGGTDKVHIGTYPAALHRVINAEGGSGFFRGDLAEVVVFDKALSDSERETVERSMCLRWRDGCAFVSMKIELQGISEELTNVAVLTELTAAIAVAAGVETTNVVIVSIVDTVATGGLRRLLQFTSSLSVTISIKFVGLPEDEAMALENQLSSSTSFENSLVSTLVSAGTVPTDASVVFAPGGSPVAGGFVSSGIAKWHDSTKTVVTEGQVHMGAYRHSVTSISVSRTNGSDGSAIVFYNTSDGSARAGHDYVSRSGYLTWNHGDVSNKYIEITIEDDDVRDEKCSFFITISKSFSEFSGFNVVGASTKEVEIIDSDLTQVYWTHINGSSSVFPSPSQGPLAGGFEVTLVGNNFDVNAIDYHCVWYTVASNGSCPVPIARPIGARSHSWTDSLTTATMCALEFMAADGSVPSPSVLSSTSMVCQAPAWSLPLDSPVFLRLGQGVGPGQVGIDRDVSAYEFMFMGPVADSAEPANVPTLGSATITITGSNFGFANVTQAMAAEFNGQDAGVLWISDSSAKITTRTPGTGVNKDISLSVFGRGSALAGVMSYDAPVVSSLTPANFFSVSGNQAAVAMSGKNFGLSGLPPPTASIYEKPCINVTWVSDSSLICLSDVQKYARFQDTGRAVDASVAVDSLSGTGAGVFQFRTRPVLSSTSPTNGRTLVSGLRNMTVFGSDFGSADNSPSVSMGGVVCTSSEWISDSSMVCRLQFVGFHPQDVSLRVSGYEGDGDVTLNDAFTFDAPLVTSLLVSNGPSAGGSHITVQGYNFGTTQQDYKCWMGNAQAGDASWISDSSLVCTTPSQKGGGAIDVQIKHTTRQSNILEGGYKFDAPCATLVKPIAVPKSGARVHVSGINFGVVPPLQTDTKMYVTVGETNCSSPTWFSDTSISCVVRPGSLSTHPVLVSRWGSPATAGCTQGVYLGYNDLTLRGMKPFNAPVVAGSPLTVYGKNFGESAPSSIKIKVGSAECASSSWVSDSTIVCDSIPGGHGTQLLVDVMVTRSNAGLSRSENGTVGFYFSYDAPRILDATGDPSSLLASSFNLTGRSVSRVQGGANVTIIGQNFGLDGQSISVRVGDNSCASLEWLSDSSIRCLTPVSVKNWSSVKRQVDCHSDSALAVASRGREALGSGFHYYIHDPVLMAVQPSNRPTVAESTISVSGACFGIQDTQPTLNLGQTSMSQVVWMSDTSIRGVVSNGSNHALDVELNILSGASILSSAFSYDSPVVTGMTPAMGPTTGDKIVTLYGQNFGAVFGIPLVASIGGNDCTITLWTSDSELTCVLPPCTTSVDLTCNDTAVPPSVNADSVSPGPALVAAFPKFKYVVPPMIDTWTAAAQVRGSGGNLTIVGKNFLGSGSRSVTVGGQSCVHTEWISDSAIRCDVPPGRGAYLTITVVVGEGAGNLYRTFSYYPDWMAVLGPWGEPRSWYNSDDLLTILLGGPFSGRWVQSWTSRSGKSPAQLLGSDGTAPKFDVSVDGGSTVEQSISFDSGDKFLVSSVVRDANELTMFLVVRPGANETKRIILGAVNKTDAEYESTFLDSSDGLPLHGFALFQNLDSHMIMQVGPDRVSAEIPAAARNGSRILVSMLIKSGACELRINGVSSGLQNCQPPVSKGNLVLGRGPTMTYYTPDSSNPGSVEIDSNGQKIASTRESKSFSGQVFDLLDYDTALSQLAVTRLERAICLENAMDQCTSLQTEAGVIQWNQDNVTVKEGQGVVEVSVGRSGGTDGYALVFVKARVLGGACSSLVHMRVPAYCDSGPDGGALDHDRPEQMLWVYRLPNRRCQRMRFLVGVRVW